MLAYADTHPEFFHCKRVGGGEGRGEGRRRGGEGEGEGIWGQPTLTYHSVPISSRESNRQQALWLHGLPGFIDKDMSEVTNAEVELMEPTGCHTRCHDDAIL